jgi:hypothetical protein
MLSYEPHRLPFRDLTPRLRAETVRPYTPTKIGFRSEPSCGSTGYFHDLYRRPFFTIHRSHGLPRIPASRY